MCRFFLPAFQSRFCCCLSKMKRAPESKAATEQETDEDEPKPDERSKAVKVKEPISTTTGLNRSILTATAFNLEIDKPKITFQEHDPPTQPLPVLSSSSHSTHSAAATPQSDQCTCVLRSTSVGQITDPLGNGNVGLETAATAAARNQLLTTRPSTAASFLQRSARIGSSTRASSSSSDSSATSKSANDQLFLPSHHQLHCPHHRLLTTETATHQLSNASPLLSYPKAISHNDATLFTRQNTIGLPPNQSGLEVRRLSDSAALNSSANKPPAGPNSFMPTRRCVLRLDGCSYLIVANPPETTTKGKDATSKSNESMPIVVRKSAQIKPVSGLRSLGSSSEQGELAGSSGGLETEIDNATIQHALGRMLTSADSMPPVDTLQACDKAATRLRELIRHLDHGQVSPEVVKKTLQYAACVLDTVSMDETRRILDEDDDLLSEVQPDAVPTEVREWLATTFTRQPNTQKRRLEDKPKFRSVANAIRAGIMVNRIYRSQVGTSVMQIPTDIIENIKSIDNWSFDCFGLNAKSKNQALKYVTFELMNRYGLLSKFKIPLTYVENFIFEIEQGYLKNKNPYHNNMHAADVTQTVHYMLFNLGLMNWLSDLEIFATLIAAIIHDYQHTGTTNNFHVMAGSEIALMYNDRAVLENFHLSTAFQVMRKEDCNITSNLSNDEYKEFRSLVIEMVLATDMNSHFQQIKTVRALLSLPHSSLIEEKPKVLSLILHCCDISHPSKDWDLHSQWTGLLIEEFFQQGDEERKRGLPYTPLCDRNSTLVPESQIGFIDFIVSPSMDVCGDLLDRIYQSLQSMSCVSESILEEESGKPGDRPKSNQMKSKLSTESTFDQGLTPSANVKDGHIFRPWVSCLEKNKGRWQEKAAEDARLRAMKKNNGADDKPE